MKNIQDNIQTIQQAIQAQNRFKWADILKGIAIILVVLFHAINANQQLFEHDKFSQVYSFISEFISNIHVPIFFFVAGIFIHKAAEKPLSKSLSSKSKSLLYPYVIWSIILGALYVTISKIHFLSKAMSNHLTIKEFLQFPIEPITILWFLYALFFITCIYLVLNKYLKFSYIFLLAVLLAVIPGANFLVYSAWHFSVKIAQFFVYFAFGILFYRLNKDFSYKINKFLFVLVLLNFVVLNTLMTTMTNNSDSAYIFSCLNLTKLVGTFSGLVALYYIAEWLQDKDKILGYIGRYSLYIYLMHPLFVVFIRFVLKKVAVFNHVLPLIILPTVLSIVLSIVSYKIIEKAKLNNLLFGR